MPRTGSVSFEIGVKPFYQKIQVTFPYHFHGNFLYYYVLFSLNPAKIVDLVGKVLTPIKLTFIGILVVVAVVNPIGKFEAPSEAYTTHAFFKGFQEGYLTMDTLASFVLELLSLMQSKKRSKTNRQIIAICAKATAIAAVILALIYSALSYMGASSVSELGRLDNGGTVLAEVSNYYFGSYGGILLGLMITVACLTTSVGLVTSCSSFSISCFQRSLIS